MLTFQKKKIKICDSNSNILTIVRPKINIILLYKQTEYLNITDKICKTHA